MIYSIIRYSGLRINYLNSPAEKQEAWRMRLEDIQWLLPHLENALRERYFADDCVVDLPFNEIVRLALENGELFAVVTEEKQLIGFALLRDIRPARDAWIEGYVAPEFRLKGLKGYKACREAMQEIIDYAFTPWNPEQTNSQKYTDKGLGLKKVKASISGENVPASRALARLGFFATGISYMDALFKGRVTDIIFLEKFNPLYLPRAEDVRQRRRRQEAQLDSTTSVSECAPVSERGPGGEQLQQLRSERGERKPSRRKRPRGEESEGFEQQRGGEADPLLAVVEPSEQPDGRAEYGERGEVLPANAGVAAPGVRRQRVVRKRPGRQ